MAIPTYDQFIGPLLQFLSQHEQPVRTKEVYAGVAELVGLTAEERARMLPSKIQAVYVNRIGWAQDALKRSLLSCAPRRGYWLLTDKGGRAGRERPGSTPRYMGSPIMVRGE
jgi:restriction system protein